MVSETEQGGVPSGDPADMASLPPPPEDNNGDGSNQSAPMPSRTSRPRLPSGEAAFANRSYISFAEPPRSPGATGESQLSPAAADRVFPIRSVVSVDPTPTPGARSDRSQFSYFGNASKARRQSATGGDNTQTTATPAKTIYAAQDRPFSPSRTGEYTSRESRHSSASTADESTSPRSNRPAIDSSHINDLVSRGDTSEQGASRPPSERPDSTRAMSFRSGISGADEVNPLITARFKHVVTDGGHAIITGRDGETLQRCEDEPIHIPGAVQNFGLLIALEEQQEGKLIVRVVSENCKRMIGYTPKQLFALESFTDVLSDDQADNLLDHVDFIRDEDADVVTNGPEVFTMSIRTPQRRSQKMWCAMHVNEQQPNLVICEFELEDDQLNPLVPHNDMTPEPPEDTLDSRPTEEEFQESTHNTSKPLRVLRSARKRKGEAAAMEVFNIMSQVQEQLAAAPNLEQFLKVLVGVVKELTGFHRVMIYQFDQSWNGRVVTELVDPRATKDLYKGLNFPASDIPKQARDMYKVNKVRMLYDRDHETARLVCRTIEDLETPLDLTHSYLRAMSPIHLKYLANMAVRSSMSISINAFGELWGLIALHSYGAKGMRVSFPIRKMCRLVGDSASRNIERLSYASRLQARKLINTVPTQSNPSGYIIASSEDLLKLFNADFGMLSIRDETKILGPLEQTQEALAMLEYLRMRRMTNVMTSLDIKTDFPDLRYPPGFKVIAGLLIVPLSSSGADFIVFFRRGQLREVKWAGNPYEKFIKEGTEGYLEPRKSFRVWSEMVVGRCREWTEEEIETAAVLCLVYGKFIEVWRQKEAALQNSQLTKLLLANSAHEVRTPLNAIINYLEIALEGSLDQETRENLSKSHSASKSLIYVINDLLDLTKTEEGGELVKDEIFDLEATLNEATEMFKGDAKRKNISYDVAALPGLPGSVVGDQRRVRQAISNVTANAIQNTREGGVRVERDVSSRDGQRCDIEVSIADTGVGMSTKKLDQLFRELEQVSIEGDDALDQNLFTDGNALPEPGKKGEDRVLGLGLAVVARIIRNMNGQLRLKSEEGHGSRFVMQFPFDLPETETKQQQLPAPSSIGSVTPQAESPGRLQPGEVTLVERDSGQRRMSGENQRGEITRKNSADSMNSRRSFASARSGLSNMSGMSWASTRSGKSEADRLIEAIQEPHRVEGHSQRGGSGRLAASSPGSPLTSSASFMTARQGLEQRHTTDATDSADISANRDSAAVSTPPSRQASNTAVGTPGEAAVMDQGMPLRPVRVPDEFSTPLSSSPPRKPASATVPPSKANAQMPSPPVSHADPGATTAEHMRVLVAEDDPVNSRIIKKRLEKLGHTVQLTPNGEDCAGTHCDRSDSFDIVLMDMQMPIVDGLTSTKMIRSFEKAQPGRNHLSARAARNGRIPIIAVSASLVERERQIYIDAGFDGWVLKPIAFDRVTSIFKGLVDREVRKENLYRAGAWERGGWFAEADVKPPADTAPSGDIPFSGPSRGAQAAAEHDHPFYREEIRSEQTQEQARLEGSQARAPQPVKEPPPMPKTSGLPERASAERKSESEASSVLDGGAHVASPEPVTEDPFR